MSDRTASPFRLSLEQQRTRAKELLRAAKDGDPAAVHRIAAHRGPGQAADQTLTLARAQFAIARELGLGSWPRLKAHVLAMRQARAAMADGPRPDDARTLHIRCGSDLRPGLRAAGFAGDFLEYSNPLCQGPVPAGEDWLAHRAAFIAEAYGALVGHDHARIAGDLAQAEAALAEAAQRYARIVLWCEHDSYDQLVLVRCLAQFAATPPRVLELISVGAFPGGARFIGLGQLPPEALRLLWPHRQGLDAATCAAGAEVWRQLRLPDPGPLAAVARAGVPGLPHLAGAVRRHCQELPWLGDGLSLTQRLVMQVLAERPRPIGEIFRQLMRIRDPLPWLGDVMLVHILREMQRARPAVFEGAPAGERWENEILCLTGVGRGVLAGAVDFLSLAPPDRWVGGVRVTGNAACWRWDDQAGAPVLMPLTRSRT